MLHEKSSTRVTITLYLLALFFPVTFYVASLIMQDTIADAKAIGQVGVIDGSLQSLRVSAYQNVSADAIEIIDKSMEYIGSEFIQKESNRIELKLQNPEMVYQSMLESWQKMKKAFALKAVPQQRVIDELFKKVKRLSIVVQAVSDAKQEKILYVLYVLLVVSMVLVILLIYFVKMHLKKQAEMGTLTDHMTKLYNRHYFLDEIKNACARTKRSKESLSVIFFSIDDFEQYRLNVRDELIVSFGKLLLPLTRSSDISCRVGENEYVIIAPKTEAEKVQILAERIRKAVHEGLYVKNQPVTISAGIVQYKFDEESYVCTRRAEKLMYEARRYRNRVMISK